MDTSKKKIQELCQQEAALQAQLKQHAKTVQSPRDPTLHTLAKRLVQVRQQKQRLLEASQPKSTDGLRSGKHISTAPSICATATRNHSPRLNKKHLSETNPATRRAEFAILDAVQRGDIALLRVEWLLEAGPTLVCRQQLPPEAFLPKSFLTRTRQVPHRVLVLSHMWLDEWHPDPHGTTLRLVQRALRLFYQGRPCGHVGLFWDFGSLNQHQPDTPRTLEQDAAFRRGLEAIPSLFLHPDTMVFQITQHVPSTTTRQQPRRNSLSYFQRGWTTVEYAWASLVKTHGKVYDLSRLHYVNTKKLQHSFQLYEVCATRTRRAPWHPDTMDQVADTLSFANGKDDRPLLKQLYRQSCAHVLPHVTHWNFAGLEWTHGAHLLEHLSKTTVPNLTSLNLSHNRLGVEFCRALSRAEVGNLQELSLSANPIGDDGVVVLAQWAWRLQKLQIASVGLTVVGCQALERSVQAHLSDMQLVHLDVSGNALGPALEAMPTVLPRLRVVVLHKNELRDRGCRALRNIANGGVSWEHLGLDDNAIESSSALETIVRRVPSLQSLSLFFNPVSKSIGDLEQQCRDSGVELSHSRPLQELVSRNTG